MSQHPFALARASCWVWCSWSCSPWNREPADGSVVELFFLGRSDEGERCAVGVQRGGDLVEVAGADLALVTRGGVSGCLRGEFGLLEFDVRAHVPLAVVLGEREHGVVEG